MAGKLTWRLLGPLEQLGQEEAGAGLAAGRRRPRRASRATPPSRRDRCRGSDGRSRRRSWGQSRTVSGVGGSFGGFGASVTAISEEVGFPFPAHDTQGGHGIVTLRRSACSDGDEGVTRRWFGAVVLVLVAAACSGDDDDDAVESSVPETTVRRGDRRRPRRTEPPTTTESTTTTVEPTTTTVDVEALKAADRRGLPALVGAAARADREPDARWPGREAGPDLGAGVGGLQQRCRAFVERARRRSASGSSPARPTSSDIDVERVELVGDAAAPGGGRHGLLRRQRRPRRCQRRASSSTTASLRREARTTSSRTPSGLVA